MHCDSLFGQTAPHNTLIQIHTHTHTQAQSHLQSLWHNSWCDELVSGHLLVQLVIGGLVKQNQVVQFVTHLPLQPLLQTEGWRKVRFTTAYEGTTITHLLLHLPAFRGLVGFLFFCCCPFCCCNAIWKKHTNLNPSPRSLSRSTPSWTLIEPV